MKSPLHDPTRAPSGQFIDRRGAFVRRRTIWRGRPLPSAPASDLSPGDLRSAKDGARFAWTFFAATAKARKKRVAIAGKGAQVRKHARYTWSGAPAHVAAAAGLSVSEQAFLDGVRARLAALQPGFTDDLVNAPPFPKDVPEILGGE